MQNEAVALLRCPICSGSFHQEGKSLLCGKRHCYDIAKQGHVNFAPNAPSWRTRDAARDTICGASARSGT